jgi:hypothetical protein
MWVLHWSGKLLIRHGLPIRIHKPTFLLHEFLILQNYYYYYCHLFFVKDSFKQKFGLRKNLSDRSSEFRTDAMLVRVDLHCVILNTQVMHVYV